MDAAGERIAPPPSQQAIHLGVYVERLAEAFMIGGGNGVEQSAFVEPPPSRNFEQLPQSLRVFGQQ